MSLCHRGVIPESGSESGLWHQWHLWHFFLPKNKKWKIEIQYPKNNKSCGNIEKRCHYCHFVIWSVTVWQLKKSNRQYSDTCLPTTTEQGYIRRTPLGCRLRYTADYTRNRWHDWPPRFWSLIPLRSIRLQNPSYRSLILGVSRLHFSWQFQFG